MRVAFLPDRAAQHAPVAGDAIGRSLRPWLEMDYGPAVACTLEISPGHAAHKAIAVRVDPGAGGFALGRHYLALDTDTLRCVAGWQGQGGIDYRGISYDGQLQGEPAIVGSLLFANPDIPGWARASGSAGEDSRYIGRDGRRYGPLAPDHGRWLGHHQRGDQVVWSYEVYETPVQEWPSAVVRDGLPLLARNFEIGPRPEPLLLQVAHDASGSAEMLGDADGGTNEKLVRLAAPGRAARETVRTARRQEDEREDFDEEEDAYDDEDEYDDEDFEEEDEGYEDDDEEEDGEDEEDDDAEDGADDELDGEILEFEAETILLVRDKQAFDLTGADYTILARIRTEEGGTIFAQAPASGAYAENSKSFFVSEGVLQFDVGWVGAVRSEAEVDDEQWHNVAMTFSHSSGKVRLYVDGEESGSGELQPTDSVDRAQVLRIGFTTPDFPDFVRGFVGEMDELAFYQRQLSEAEIQAFGSAAMPADRLVAHWTAFDHDDDLLVDATGHGHDAVLEDIDIEGLDEEDEEDEEEQRERRLRFDGETVRLAVANLPVDEATEASYTIAARIRTEEGGPIFAVAAANESWRPNNVCWFIRDGRLVFDLGFVGQVEGSTEVADGQWHDVAMTYNRDTGKVVFLVDGQEDPASEPGEELALVPLELGEEDEHDKTAWIGYASEDFPEEAPQYFHGRIEQLRIYEGTLDAEEVARVMEMPADESLGVVAAWMPALAVDGVVEDESGNEFDAVLEGEAVDGPAHEEPEIETTVCGVAGAPAGSRWVLTDDGHVRLEIPAGKETLRMTVWYAGVVAGDTWGELPGLQPLAAQPEPRSVKPQPAVTDVSLLGAEDEAFVVDEIRVPDPNPHGSRMRLCGLDFFADGRSAALSTLAGEVWIVEGLGKEELTRVAWRRIATGLYQPLGLKIVDKAIYVTCRDQIVRLRDENGDGQIDFYESFNHDAQVTAHYGEFAVDLETDAEGNFYYAKGARRGLPPVVPQHGTLLRVASDGSSTQIVATGLRAPAGLTPTRNNAFYATDLAGRWTPANKINVIREGQFYGNNYAFNPPTTFEQYAGPMIWIDDAVDRGPSDAVVVSSTLWGPLAGELLCLSNASGAVHVVLRQTTTPATLGALYPLPLAELPAGSCRGRFNPADGHLYVCGLGDLTGQGAASGGFYRIRATGSPIALPIELGASDEGLTITFSEPLERKSATDWRNYAAARWSYRRTAQYGSDRYRVSDPRRRGRDRLRVEDVRLSGDKRTVLVRFAEMPATDQMRLQLNLKTERGDQVRHTIHFTCDAPGDG